MAETVAFASSESFGPGSDGVLHVRRFGTVR
jgi:hypothetical protein